MLGTFSNQFLTEVQISTHTCAQTAAFDVERLKKTNGNKAQLIRFTTAGIRKGCLLLIKVHVHRCDRFVREPVCRVEGHDFY